MKKRRITYWIIKHMPKRLKYLTAIDVIAYATCGKYGNTIVPELTAMDAIKRYGKDKGVE